MTDPHFAAAVLAAGAALGLTPLVLLAARRAGAVDRPGPDKVHVSAVPTLGGLAVVGALLGTLWALEAAGIPVASRQSVLALTVAALPILAVGVVDDLRGVGVAGKLAAHVAAGVVLYAFGFRVTALTNPFGDSIPLGTLALPITLVWVVALVNAMNLVDGLDGLAAGVGAIAALALARVGALQGEADVYGVGLVLAFAVAGFFPFNYPRARVFLGDVGSTFIGLVLATLALLQNRKATTTLTLLVPILALGLPVLDTAFAVVRRALLGRSPVRRDLGHLHHRLLRLGLSARQVVALLLGATALLGEGALRMAALPKQRALLATVSLALAALALFVGLVWIERRGERAGAEGPALQKA